MSFPYRYYRSRFRPKTVKKLSEGYFSVRQTAELCDLSTQTVRIWMLKGKIPAVKYKNKLFVRL